MLEIIRNVFLAQKVVVGFDYLEGLAIGWPGYYDAFIDVACVFVETKALFPFQLKRTGLRKVRIRVVIWRLTENLAIAAAAESQEGVRGVFSLQLVVAELEVNAVIEAVFNTVLEAFADAAFAATSEESRRLLEWVGRCDYYSGLVALA